MCRILQWNVDGKVRDIVSFSESEPEPGSEVAMLSGLDVVRS